MSTSDFPRGWTFSNVTINPNTTSITVPAIPGVVHVLDSFTATTVGSVAVGQTITLASSDGVFAGFILALLSQVAGGTADASVSGLDLAAGPGASLTIAYGAVTNAGNENLLIVQGHDI
jgi:hypothetical protein